VLIVARATPPESTSATACVNTILMHLGRYLRIARGVIEFNKLKLVSTYLHKDPPLVDADVLGLVDAALAGRMLTAGEVGALRRTVAEWRPKMNELLGISV
jgi:hypothetical protein